MASVDAAGIARLEESVRGRLRRVDRGAHAWLRNSPSDEVLHRLHQEARRLRIEMRLLRRIARGGGPRAGAAREDPLRSLTRAFGRARDADVGLRTVRRVALGAAPRGRAAAEAVVRRYAREADRCHRRLRGVLEGPGFRALLRRVAAEAARPMGGPALERADGAVRKELRRRRRRLIVRLKEARQEPSPSRLHRLRQATRAVRTLRTTVAAMVGGRRPRWPGPLARLQSLLGRLHDLDRVLGGTTPQAARRVRWLEELLAARRARLGREAGRLLEDPGVRRRIRRFARAAA